MKTNKYQERFYRDWVEASDLHVTQVALRETDLQILTNKALDIDFVKSRIQQYRWDIEDYITKDMRFLTSLKPIAVELRAPEIVKDMNEVAKKANVGPMAAVAGAIAKFIGRDLLRRGYKDVIIENGGDIFIKTTKARRVGIYAGRQKLWKDLKLKLKPQDTPLGICTSSGTLGHSLSFGSADSVVVLSKDASLADAVATATANRVQSKEDLQRAVDFAKSVEGVLGVVVILKKHLISWGKIEFLT